MNFKMAEELVLVPKYKYEKLKERADHADSVKDEKPCVKSNQDKSKNSLLQLQSKNSIEKNKSIQTGDNSVENDIPNVNRKLYVEKESIQTGGNSIENDIPSVDRRLYVETPL